MSWGPKEIIRGLVIGTAALLGSACEEGGAEGVRMIRLEQMRPRPSARQGVFLNEALVFHFSAEIDPSSVTRESLVVRPRGGAQTARGTFEIDGDRVRFLPALGLARDLSDGGLKPGTRYEVLVRGFPAPDGLRSASGTPLGRSSRFFFETAALTVPRGQMFEDRSADRGSELKLRTRQLHAEDSLFLTCDEPLDPSTLVDGEFKLQSLLRPEESVSLDAILRTNSYAEGARLELRPRRRLGPGEHALAYNPQVSVRDFGGNAVWFPDLPGSNPVLVEAGAQVLPVLVESFLETRLRSPLVVPGVDGSAAWNGDGRVTIRFPAAAGSGLDGEQRLSGVDGRKDVHATRLTVPEGSELELLSVPGLVVLRAQGSLRVDGRLLRRSGVTEQSMKFKDRPRLTHWLEQARELDPAWTVLIAGGDLVVDGEIDVEGPLLLVAGGRIRVTGAVHAQDLELYVAGSRVGGGLDPTASPADLVLDPPLRNPLVEPLTFAVVSGPMPPTGGVLRWGRATVEKYDGIGQVRVEFLPGDLRPGDSLEDWGAVKSPRDLLSAEALRLLLFLTVEPADPEGRARVVWDPPVIDDVRLEWEPGRR